MLINLTNPTAQEFYFKNENDSTLFAKKLANSLQGNEIILFQGDLGVGKTFICRRIIKEFCGEEITIVSPTFNLLQTYKTSLFTIFHLDLYRLKYPEELLEIGVEDAFKGNVCLVEWGEKAINFFPKPYLLIRLNLLNSIERLCLLEYVI